eukprot:6201300-Prymnesium_polylepis.1
MDELEGTSGGGVTGGAPVAMSWWAQHDAAWHVARHVAQHSTARHGTARHRTAQHGTARHSTAHLRRAAVPYLIGSKIEHAQPRHPEQALGDGGRARRCEGDRLEELSGAAASTRRNSDVSEGARVAGGRAWGRVTAGGAECGVRCGGAVRRHA